MTRNMGTVDRIIRVMIAMLIAVMYFTGIITDTVALILGILAIIFSLTSLVGFCPLYMPFGLRTCKSRGSTEPGK